MKQRVSALLPSLSISLLLLLLGTEGCKKDMPAPINELDKLPPATQTGQGTFGCLINGKAYITKSSSQVGAVYQLSFLQFGADYPDHNIGILINKAPIINKVYDLTNLGESLCHFNSRSDSKYCDYPPQNTTYGHVIITTFDTLKKVVSGTFEFATYVSPYDTIRVTNGRFDLPLYL